VQLNIRGDQLKKGVFILLTMIVLIFGTFFIGVSIGSYYEIEKEHSIMFLYIGLLIIIPWNLSMFKVGKTLEN
jgi:membrane protein CcdC involved in cytochrome C biogenesis